MGAQGVYRACKLYEEWGGLRESDGGATSLDFSARVWVSLLMRLIISYVDTNNIQINTQNIHTHQVTCDYTNYILGLKHDCSPYEGLAEIKELQ
jgi:hypothetical protein